jgi:hypothetical protein
MAPSIKTLNRYFDPETAKQVRGLITGKIDPETIEAVSNWVGQCYHRPSDDELIMAALNAVIGGYGTEVVRGRYVDNYHQDIQASYINTGDTYSTTILLDHETGNYQVTTWGDWFETNEKRRRLL